MSLTAIGMGSGVAAEPITNWMEVSEHAVRTASSANPYYRTPEKTRIETQVALAMFEAANAVDRRYTSFLNLPPEPRASADVAVAAAAHAVLSRMLPEQSATFDTALAVALAAHPDGEAKTRGKQVGEAAAAAAIARSAAPKDLRIPAYRPVTAIGEYIHPSLPSLREFDVVMPPYLLTSPSQFRPAGPLAVKSKEYAQDLEEVRRLGAKNSSARTAAKTALAKMILSIDYAPIIAYILNGPGRSLVRNARTYALVQVASDDAWIAAVDAKLHFRNWRPITAIRNADRDGNALTTRDETWEPLLTTPAHPDYVCAHCVNAAAIATVLESETGPAPEGGIRITAAGHPGIEYIAKDWRDFVDEVSMSRIYAGAHTRYANVAGEDIGRKVGRLALSQMTAR